jgi:hypothetical protein
VIGEGCDLGISLVPPKRNCSILAMVRYHSRLANSSVAVRVLNPRREQMKWLVGSPVTISEDVGVFTGETMRV